jgi:hypothetical protein
VLHRTVGLVAIALVLSPLLLVAPRRSSVGGSQDLTPTTASYLPLVKKDSMVTPSATPKATVTPPGQDMCGANEPELGVGAQAWMAIANPPPYGDTTLCVRLTLNGEPVTGATVTAVVHYQTTNTVLGPAVTRGDGISQIPFNIGGASSGFTVLVDTQTIFNGQTYTAQTSFTPQ